ncbi:MAG: photosynthetic reaction center cytochrome PufC [Pseudomonadota bacterium]
MNDDIKTGVVTLGAVALLAFGAWAVFFRSGLETEQIGFRGVAIEQPEFTVEVAEQKADNVAPEEVYEIEPDDGASERAYEIYENVQVLGHLSEDNFNRIMAQITEWVSPEQGCAYCHGDEGEFAHDDIYAKVVARRMIQMTQHINAEWGDHVGGAGVNCYTCHRGQNVPSNLWFKDPATENAGTKFIGEKFGQNTPVAANAYSSTNVEPYSRSMLGDGGVRVIDDVAITRERGASIQATEHTYSLMMNWSQALGVGCTYCHNSRAFSSWEQSPPTRVKAWHAQNMARALNVTYLEPLGPEYPENRLGPLGDAPKLNCATCHNGAPKPLLGADMISLYPSLAKAGPADQQDPLTGPAAAGD